MKKMKGFLCLLLTICMLTSTIAIPHHAIAEENEEVEAAGWYLTDYKLVINTKETTGSFSQGGTYSDIVKIYDLEGNEMTGLSSDFENDIRLTFGRYNPDNGDMYCGYSQFISWDSPEDYYAEGTVINLTNLSNLEEAHLAWGCRNISARFNLKTIKDTYDYRFLDGNGSDQFGIGSQDITVKTDRAIPKGVRGDKAYLLINFDYYPGADSQAIYTYEWKAPDHKLKAKTYDTKPSKKGWYLTGYNFEYDPNDYYESRFGDGSLCVDTKALYDANGDRAKSSYLENDIYVYNERYIGAYQTENLAVGVRYEIKWDSPASYIASGEQLKITKFSNQVITTTDVWGTPDLHLYAETTGFYTEIADSNGNSSPGATGPITMKASTAFPEGTNNQKLAVYLAINGIGRAVYTYTWKTGELAVPSVAKSKLTLYLSGSNKNITAQIGLKNAAGYTVTYKSRKTSVATVSKSGLITAKKAGTANIVVTFKGGGKTYTKTIKVEVKKK